MKRNTIEIFQEIAKSKGGMCLSDKYETKDTKLLWECKYGHQWEATPGHIKLGTWCPECCGTKKLTIEEMQNLAKNRGGKCLSDRYINNQTKLLWECSNNHRWETIPTVIKSGAWCPYCSGVAKSTIEEMGKIAFERGGKCLSDIYSGAHEKLLWRCAHGHEWNATANIIKRGSWCPQCSDGLGERICREFFTQLFDKKFPKSYPKWLVNEEGNQLELDGYNDEMKLAFEHQGKQHYEEINFYKMTKKSLDKIKNHDLIKRKLCIANDVSLIEIPEIFSDLKVKDIRFYIADQLKKENIVLPKNFFKCKINLRNAYESNGAKILLEQIKNAAENNKGKCLADVYITARTKMTFECGKGHRWKSIPDNIKRGSWCPYCAGTAKGSIQEMQSIAKNRGGKCVSNVYKSRHSKLTWECSNGHRWKAIPNNILKGKWCPVCSKNVRNNIYNLKVFAQKKRGKCISEKYINSFKKLLWECEKGHQWWAKPSNILKGTWCPKCGIKSSAAKRSSSITEMEKLANNNGGECLTKLYTNNRSKLKWKCHMGHIWEALPTNIMKGKWCPVCAGNAKSNIFQMQEIAKSRGGKIISEIYVNTHSKLLWECSTGHIWKAIPSNIKKGQWCPICGKQKVK
jgi:hypothetical protein